VISFGSVCSGIEAASVAWGPLGWRAAWLAEIEAFPAAVLAHHYPEVSNLGDMTQIAAMVRAGLVEAPDVLCGGTPCQAFSVAGLRRSLDDARGNLSLTFCELANDIDTRRKALGKPPAVVFWENVPGVLTTRDNAFGCFLAGLAGEADPLSPPGGKWANAGFVLGPQRTVAWRILDAQYFGVAQRRRRVFVVASARTGFDPAAVLFEFHGVRRDTAPRREAGQNLAGCLAACTDGGGFPGTDEALGGYVQPAVVGPLTAACGPNGHGGSGLATDKGAEAGHILAFGGNRTSGAIDVSPALLAQPGSGWKGDFESETFLVAHTLRGEGFDASEDGTHPSVQKVASFDDVAQCLRARTPGNIDNSSTTVVAQPSTGVVYAHYSHDFAHDRITDPSGVSPSLAAASNASGGLNVAVAFNANAQADQLPSVGRDTSVNDGLTCSQQAAVALQWQGGSAQDQVVSPAGVSPTLAHSSCAHGGHNEPKVLQGLQVRRLTPVECERLQGFPDGYTDIPWTEYQRIQRQAEKAGSSFEAELKKRGKVLRGPNTPACPDGPRYKALGNSWAVPVVAWLGERIYCEILMAEIQENAA